jgi:hypothetical protein
MRINCLKPTLLMLRNNTRRYVILTYSTEFERVHYPLALSYISQPDVKTLKKVLERLSSVYEDEKSFDGEARSSAYSCKTNEFFRTGMANYNPLLEENKQLK